LFSHAHDRQAAAAARIGAGLGRRKRAELLDLLRPCFTRVEPWLQAGKYAAALMSDLPRRNGWTLAERAGDRTLDRMQRLLSRAVWDAAAAMTVVRRFAVTGLDEAAGKAGRRCGLAVGALDETGQVKAGDLTAGVKRQYLGCVGKVANGINTVHLAYVREGTGHALIGAREWIPAAQIGDPATSAVMGLPEDLVFRTKGQLAIDILTEAAADGCSWTSCAAMRCTAHAPSCAPTWKTAARPTRCGSRPASGSPSLAGSR
jgi:SRSO17 transposase